MSDTDDLKDKSEKLQKVQRKQKKNLNIWTYKDGPVQANPHQRVEVLAVLVASNSQKSWGQNP